MSVRHYTIEQLLQLRESPLVKKPEDLPAIEQWIEYLYLDKDSREKLRIPHSESAAQQQAQPQQPQSQKDGNTKDARSRVTRPSNNGDASPMGNFSTGQRPSLMQTRSHASKAGDDVVLGPPKTAFSSSSRFSRTNTTEEAPSGGDGAEGTRTRAFGERQQNRNTKSIGEKDGGRDWTALRQPKGPADFDDQKDGPKFGRRDRERDNEGERRNGDKQDSRWGQRDERRQNGERQGGWRDRENNRQNRGWDRNEQPEKEPEWFDEPMKKQEEDLGVGTAHTQADFQKWKEMMKGNKAPAEEASQAQPPPAQTTPAKQSAPIKLDGFSEPMFGGFGVKAVDSPSEGAASVAKTPQAKGKSSRFASVFKKEEAPQPPLQEPPAQQQLPTLEPGQGLNEDKAGFQRILQMLGGANIGGPPQATPGSGGPSEPASPQIRGPAAGPKQKSRFFDSAPKSPGEVHSPQSRFQSPRVPAGNTVPPVGRNMVDDPSGFFGLPMSKPPQESPALPFPPSNVVSPEPSQPPNGNQASYPQQNRPNESTGSGPPSRGSATPDVGIQNLLAAQRAQRPQASNKDSEFLLGLLQGQGPRPASQQTRPNQDFNLWVGQPPEPHAPKPRVPPPPGLIDDQLLRNAPPEMSRHDQPPMGGPDAARRSSQRVPTGAPPGFDEHMFMQQQMQQRRNFGEGPPQPPQPQQPPPNRRMGGHPSMSGMPPQQQPPFPPDFPFMQAPPGPPQGPHQGPPPGPPQGHPQGPPQGPPGFAPNMRHPQGFANGPNIFQAQQQREPPGFGGMMQNSMSPPAPPPGFGGPPPGMPPGLMGMRSPPFEGMPGQRR